MSKLTHFNEDGAARMVDVGGKPSTHRVAVAEGSLSMAPATLAFIAEGGHRKGDVLGVARVAGIMAAKKTAEFIPLCHPLSLTHIDIALELREDDHCVYCQVRAETIDQTGVEMEALNAVQVTLLTTYDMCKAVDRGMTIEYVRLLEKSGGRSGRWIRDRQN